MNDEELIKGLRERKDAASKLAADCIKRLTDELKSTLEREAESYHRHDAKEEAAEAELAKAVDALRKLITCVDDGCYCSEMQMASTMDEACAVLRRAMEKAVLKTEPTDSLEQYYERQIEWSKTTFGPALRTNGIIDHITKELAEIAADPHDLSEWVDVMILAMDGFWRHGGTAKDIMPALLAKQTKNMARNWPDWRTRSEDQAIEHDRSGEVK